MDNGHERKTHPDVRAGSTRARRITGKIISRTRSASSLPSNVSVATGQPLLKSAADLVPVVLSHEDSQQGLLAFHDLIYCGRQVVESPVSEAEASRCMTELFPRKDEERLVDLTVPKDSGGILSLSEAESEEAICRYPVRYVLFCARGTQLCHECVAFTVAEPVPGDSRRRSFICHVLFLGDDQKVCD